MAQRLPTLQEGRLSVEQEQRRDVTAMQLSRLCWQQGGQNRRVACPSEAPLFRQGADGRLPTEQVQGRAWVALEV